MTKRANFLLTCIVILLMAILGVKVFDYKIEPLLDQYHERSKVYAELKVSPKEYETLLHNLEDEKSELTDKINRQTEQIQVIESSMAFLMKEDVFKKVSQAVEGTGASFDNFYVTNEGTIKNDYSVQVKGDVYQINKFIQNICTDSPGISIGEFSIRENEEANFLSRYFDDSNALMWYDGTIYNAGKIEIDQADTGATSEISEQAKKLATRLPNAKDIKYVMTLTFRV